jgi:hypothetical protein
MSKKVSDRKTGVSPWRYKGRCGNPECGAKVVGCRRAQHCGCGGRVSYR